MTIDKRDNKSETNLTTDTTDTTTQQTGSNFQLGGCDVTRPPHVHVQMAVQMVLSDKREPV